MSDVKRSARCCHALPDGDVVTFMSCSRRQRARALDKRLDTLCEELDANVKIFGALSRQLEVIAVVRVVCGCDSVCASPAALYSVPLFPRRRLKACHMRIMVIMQALLYWKPSA